MLARILTWTIAIVAVVIAAKVVMMLLGLALGVVGVAFGLLVFLAFTVLPVALLVWLGMKIFGHFKKKEAAI